MKRYKTNCAIALGISFLVLFALPFEPDSTALGAPVQRKSLNAERAAKLDSSIRELFGGAVELDRSIVPSPQELYSTLAALNREQLKNDWASMLLEQFKESDFSNLSTEEKGRLGQAMQKFLQRDNGIDPELGKQYLKDLGFDERTQQQFAEQADEFFPEGGAPSYRDLARQFKKNSERAVRSYSKAADRKKWSKSSAKASGIAGRPKTGNSSTTRRSSRNPKLPDDKSLKKMLGNLPKLASGMRDKQRDPNAPKVNLGAEMNSVFMDAFTESVSEKKSNVELPDSVRSGFKTIVDKVRETVVKNKNKNRLKKNSGPRGNGNSNSNSSANSSDINWANFSKGTSSSSSGTGSVGSGLSAAIKDLPELPTINPTQILVWLAVLAGIGFLIYLLISRMETESGNSVKKQLSRMFGRNKNSPSGLVDEVDHFLISKFGSDSKWWNSKHAQQILVSAAPDFKAKISELTNLYVRARYMDQNFVLTDEEKKRCQSTLQELARLALEKSPHSSVDLIADDLVEKVNVAGAKG